MIKHKMSSRVILGDTSPNLEHQTQPSGHFDSSVTMSPQNTGTSIGSSSHTAIPYLSSLHRLDDVPSFRRDTTLSPSHHRDGNTNTLPRSSPGGPISSISPSASRLTPQCIGDILTAIAAPEINIDLGRLAPRLDDEQISDVQSLIISYGFVHRCLITTMA